MKIERFNNINENLTIHVKDFIENFAGGTDNGIIDWVDVVSDNTKLNDYKNFMSSRKKALNFARSKNFKKLEEYLLIDNEIANKEKEIEKLNKKKENLNIGASEELLYKFQEDLLNINDFDNFYQFFIEDSVENSPTNEIEDILKYSEIHPRILKKYKNKIVIGVSAKKYNI
jgi:hypothetical protein